MTRRQKSALLLRYLRREVCLLRLEKMFLERDLRRERAKAEIVVRRFRRVTRDNR